MNEVTVRHASRLDDSRDRLCGAASGRPTNVQESINCPTCRAILNHVRQRYGDEYHHRGLTATEAQEATRAMYADLVGGEIEG